MDQKLYMRIVLTGGGTMGTVSPLLAVADQLRQEHPATKFLFIGTRGGPERGVVGNLGLPFSPIFAGKFRRYWSLANLSTPLLFFLGFIQALFLLTRFKPTCVYGAGGFVQVPVMYAAWIMRIPRLIHQQDVEVTLSNLLCAPIATKITVSLEHSLRDFAQGLGLFSSNAEKIVWTGNPVRPEVLKADIKSAKNYFKLQADLPVVLITGGSSGARGLNEIIWQALPAIVQFAQVIHTIGRGNNVYFKHENYKAFEFLERMDLALAFSDVVISRAGLSAISELSFLQKPSIIVPMPDTHQESNAALLWSTKAAIVLDQSSLDAAELVSELRKLLIDGKRQGELSRAIGTLMPRDATNRIAEIIRTIHS